MRFLVVNQYGQSVIESGEVIPRVGDKIDLFCQPYPTVSTVLMYPSKRTLNGLSAGNIDVIAIITVV